MKFKLLLVCFLLVEIQSLNVSRASQTDSDKELKELAVIAHDLSYQKQEDIVAKEKDTFTDFLKELINIEVGGFRASLGRFDINNKIAVITFRGTQISWANVSADFWAWMVPITNKADKEGYGCLVHQGFLEAYKNNLRTKLREFTTILKEWVSLDKLEKLVITGHSLGGALANLMAYDLGVHMKRTKEFHVDIILATFGCPRVGDQCFSDVLNHKLGLVANARIIFGTDSIPSVPYIKDYVHSGTEYHVTTVDSYSVKKFNVDETPRAKRLSGAFFKLVTQFPDHSKYKTISKDKIYEIVKANIALVKESKASGPKLEESKSPKPKKRKALKNRN